MVKRKHLIKTFLGCYLPPLDPNDAMISVKRVRKRGVPAEKYDTSTVLSSLLVRRTKKTRSGTTRKLYPIM